MGWLGFLTKGAATSKVSFNFRSMCLFMCPLIIYASWLCGNGSLDLNFLVETGGIFQRPPKTVTAFCRGVVTAAKYGGCNRSKIPGCKYIRVLKDFKML